ncbi:hypothetical protein PLICRDRAFT_132735 [Plicaturopsis crispa FD-325 SS-3]|nr:hypothetical protein PLICRDRAFT_132735 [Plicaturopsis crispa FD-325 SS-3]
MAIDTHVRRGHPIVFGLLVFFSIIELAISAWLTSRFNAHHNYQSLTERDRVRLLLFDSCWTIFFGLFYGVLFTHSPNGSALTSVASHGVFLIITWILWTAGAAAITENLGGGLNCKQNNAEGLFVYCGQLNALEGFAWVIWILITFALIVVLFRGISSARRGDGFRGHLIA